MENERSAGQKRKRVLIAFPILLLVLILTGLVAFSVGHSRHYTILLDLKTVEITETTEEDNPYLSIRITGKARQWWFDTSTRTFCVKKHESGDLPFTVQPSDVLTTSFLNSTDFTVKVSCRKEDLPQVSLGVTAADGSWHNDIGYWIVRDKKLFRFVTTDE